MDCESARDKICGGWKMENTVYIYRTKSIYSNFNEHDYKYIRSIMSEILEQIRPGYTVVLKPNLVKESHLEKKNEWESVITNSEVIRIVLEAVADRLEGCGTIRILDGPQEDSSMRKIVKRLKLREMVSEIQRDTKVQIEIIDVRQWRRFTIGGICVYKKKLNGDPRGNIEIDLKEKSEFWGKKNQNYYGADYDMDEARSYHNQKKNMYVMARSALDCDVFINLPKLKTHKIGGITCCLKNLVGICTIRNSIPHHTIGSPETNGDRFQRESGKRNSETRLKSLAYALLKKGNPFINLAFVGIKKGASFFFGGSKKEIIRNGYWYGNDTLWRSVLDLNKILIYADREGIMRDTPQRKYYALVDGIIAGEGNGPMTPDRKHAGIVIAGSNPVFVDTAAAAVMGYDYRKISCINKAYGIEAYKLAVSSPDKMIIKSNVHKWDGKKISQIPVEDTLKFKASFGWKNHIEMDPDRDNN